MSEPQIPADQIPDDGNDGHTDTVDETDYADPDEFPEADGEEG